MGRTHVGARAAVGDIPAGLKAMSPLCAFPLGASSSSSSSSVIPIAWSSALSCFLDLFLGSSYIYGPVLITTPGFFPASSGHPLPNVYRLTFYRMPGTQTDHLVVCLLSLPYFFCSTFRLDYFPRLPSPHPLRSAVSPPLPSHTCLAYLVNIHISHCLIFPLRASRLCPPPPSRVY